MTAKVIFVYTNLIVNQCSWYTLQVSNFPIFLPFGNVNVSIEVNVEVLYLDHERHKKLENFHNKLFVDVLGIKDFTVRSYDNEDSSYLVVPISSAGLIFHI